MSILPKEIAQLLANRPAVIVGAVGQLATIRGIVRRILFINETKNYAVVTLETVNGSATFRTSRTCVWPGIRFSMETRNIVVDGVWADHPRYGVQLEASIVRFEPPQTVEENDWNERIEQLQTKVKVEREVVHERIFVGELAVQSYQRKEHRGHPVFIGTFESESQATEAFDKVLDQCQLFEVHSEVEGVYEYIRPGNEQKDPRIDRVLLPRARLVEAGWKTPIGVEAKCSGSKIGPAVVQAEDYGRAKFFIGGGHCCRGRCGVQTITTVYLDWIFLWPLAGQDGDLASIMTHNRIGTVYTTDDALVFSTCSPNLIHWSGRGLKVQPFNAGRKTGSR